MQTIKMDLLKIKLIINIKMCMTKIAIYICVNSGSIKSFGVDSFGVDLFFIVIKIDILNPFLYNKFANL